MWEFSKLATVNHLDQCSPFYLALKTGFMKDNFFHGEDGNGFSFTHCSLSALQPRFLTGHGLVWVHGPGVGDPWLRIPHRFHSIGIFLELKWSFHFLPDITQNEASKNMNFPPCVLSGITSIGFVFSVTLVLIVQCVWECILSHNSA